MADDKVRNGKGTPRDDGESKEDDFGALTGGDGDLGNLPPLSDFESSSGAAEEGSLPPLGNLDFESSDGDSLGGLPPIEDLSVETPIPTGGAIKQTPPGFESSGRGAGSAFRSPIDEPRHLEGSGFQDLSADSHFPTATPDLSPGPETPDMETPMFDSAFGEDSAFGGGRPAPTQAMETPMFETPPDLSGSDASPFDGGGFGVTSPFEEGGTPMPDFSPDTGVEGGTGEAPEAPGKGKKGQKKAKKAKAVAPAGAGGGGIGIGGILIAAALVLVAAVAGICAGPLLVSKLSFLSFVPNPTAEQLAAANAAIAQKDSQIKKLTQEEGKEAPGLTPEQIDQMVKQRDELQAAITTLTGQHEQAESKLQQLRSDVAMVEEDIEAKNEEYIQAQESYEELVNETAIVKARQVGLRAEVDRLTSMAGELEDANNRRLATKDALVSDIQRLEIAVKEGIPLTPEKYSRAARIEAVQELARKANMAKWVTPALLKEYTELYQREMEIAAKKEYFYASIPVVDKFGSKDEKWAECLMMGNWSVYYRTLDGKNIGVYENIAESETPRYGFRDILSPRLQKTIEEDIFSARDEDYAAKIRVLAEKEEIRSQEAGFQEAFDSL